MPLYEYQCTRCKQRFEKIEKVSGPHAKKCPKCGGKVERLMTAAAIQFKGSGWYVTDYARAGASSRDTKNAEAAKGAESAKAEKSEKESKESAPAKESKESKKGKKED